MNGFQEKKRWVEIKKHVREKDAKENTKLEKDKV